MLERGYMGTYDQMSRKHLHRYVNEFAGRHNARELNTLTQMEDTAAGLQGGTLPWKRLVA